MTRRERLERKAEKRREWADGRRAKASASFSNARKATEHIPFGQPILVGHHSERRHRNNLAKSDSAMRAGCESLGIAEAHTSKADGLEAQLERTIYSDDADAIERLQEKIEGLEAERDEMKRLNALFRKGGREALSEKIRVGWDRLVKCCPYEKVPFPAYALSNSGAEIRRCKKRIENLKSASAPTSFREIVARFDSVGTCGHAISKGDRIGWQRTIRETRCADCWAELKGGVCKIEYQD